MHNSNGFQIRSRAYQNVGQHYGRQRGAGKMCVSAETGPCQSLSLDLRAPERSMEQASRRGQLQRVFDVLWAEQEPGNRRRVLIIFNKLCCRATAELKSSTPLSPPRGVDAMRPRKLGPLSVVSPIIVFLFSCLLSERRAVSAPGLLSRSRPCRQLASWLLVLDGRLRPCPGSRP